MRLIINYTFGIAFVAALFTSYTDSFFDEDWLTLVLTLLPIGWPVALFEGVAIWFGYYQ